MKKHGEKLPLQYNPVYVLGRLKRLILHHSSLNLAGCFSRWEEPLQMSWCGMWALLVPFPSTSPSYLGKWRHWYQSLRIKTNWGSPPHFQTEIWHFLTNILIGYNVASSITGIKCLECNTETLQLSCYRGEKEFSIPPGCCAKLGQGRAFLGQLHPRGGEMQKEEQCFVFCGADDQVDFLVCERNARQMQSMAHRPGKEFAKSFKNSGGKIWRKSPSCIWKQVLQIRIFPLPIFCPSYGFVCFASPWWTSYSSKPSSANL